MLAQDEPLPHRYFDHLPGGELNDHRDCHIRRDLVLIYPTPDDTSLESGSARIASLAYSGRPSQNSGTVRSLKRRVVKS